MFKGIIDVTLTQVGTGAGYIEVAVTESCGGVNLYDVYKTQLLVAANWSLKKAGATQTISAVADVPGKKAFKITTAVTGAMTLSLAALSVLIAAGVDGYESDTLSFTL